MKLSTRTATASRQPGISGPARTDRRLSNALRRADPGDVLLIDHVDLDRASAELIADSGVAVVVNASAFISGRFPNLGPEVLAQAGVTLVDCAGSDVLSRVKDGQRVRWYDGQLTVGDRVVASGRELSLDDVVAQMDQAREGLNTQLTSFTHNTTEFLRREQDLLLHGRGVPDLDVRIAGRPVVVVVRDFEHHSDLARLRRFIREQRPVLIGVDGGADALLEKKLTPDVVVIGASGIGGSGSDARQVVSDKALTSAREVLLHADSSDRMVGGERLDRLGIRARRLAASGSTEDVALLVADIQGASLIVTVGAHATLDEFLDKQRTGMSSSFLTRLRVGPRVIDAKAVPVLYTGRVRLWHLALVVLIGVLAVAVCLATTPVGADWFAELNTWMKTIPDRIEGLTP